MDGLFEIMFVLILVVASILDATARSRKKKRRIEEMEREEREEATVPARTADREARWNDTYEARREDADEASGEKEDRETADAMVPPDLWAILTGQAPPRPSHTEREEERSPARTVAREKPKEPAARADPKPPPVLPESSRWGRSTPTVTPPRPKAPIGRGAGVGLPEEGGSSWAGRVLRVPPRAQRKVRESPYSKLLESGKRGDLRQAIVLTEILGPPLALRSRQEPWEPR